MANDGHTGITNAKVNEGESEQFALVLSHLRRDAGPGEYVIHVAATRAYGGGVQPGKFLEDSGFARYHGPCPFHEDPCYYREVVRWVGAAHAVGHAHEAALVHHDFRLLVARIDGIYRAYQQYDGELRELHLGSRARALFNPLGPPHIAVDESDTPAWLAESKFPSLVRLEEQREAVQAEIDRLGAFLPLLHATGTPLEQAVIAALRFLGLDAQLAPKGFTADVLAESSDGALRFGFEVTGIGGPVKKDSPKLTQLSDFERIKEHGEKAVLVANPHRLRPLPERAGLDDFTPQVVSFFGPHPVLLMTSLDLYRMVGDALAGSRSAEELVQLLHAETGRLVYPGP